MTNPFRRFFKKPELNSEIKTVNLTMDPGTVKTFRLFNDSDRTKDRTLVVYAGQLDSRKLRDVELILAGTHTAHRRPGLVTGTEGMI